MSSVAAADTAVEDAARALREAQKEAERDPVADAAARLREAKDKAAFVRQERERIFQEYEALVAEYVEARDAVIPTLEDATEALAKASQLRLDLKRQRNRLEKLGHSNYTPTPRELVRAHTEAKQLKQRAVQLLGIEV
jgi:hypothetical protein